MTGRGSGTAVKFGHTELPGEQQEALRKARKYEWISIAFLAASTAMVYAVLGNSQAMKAAWVEDVLSFLPPLSFLLAARVIRRPPSEARGSRSSAGETVSAISAGAGRSPATGERHASMTLTTSGGVRLGRSPGPETSCG